MHVKIRLGNPSNFLFTNDIQMASTASNPNMSAKEQYQALLAQVAVMQAQAERSVAMAQPRFFQKMDTVFQIKLPLF